MEYLVYDQIILVCRDFNYENFKYKFFFSMFNNKQVVLLYYIYGRVCVIRFVWHGQTFIIKITETVCYINFIKRPCLY